jgi:uncharacterized protein (TIGR03067 family)
MPWCARLIRISTVWVLTTLLGAAFVPAAEPSGDKAATDKPAAEKSEADKPDAEKILGKWVLKETDRPNPIFNGDGQTVELVFEESKFEFAVLKDGGKIFQIPGTYFIDDKQTPKLFDVSLTGDGGSNSVFAIYDFKDGNLRIRLRDNNGQRPADFETKEADCQTLTFARPETK